MNSTLLNLFGNSTQPSAGNALSGTSSLTGHGLTKTAASLGDMMFGQLLSAQLQNAGTASTQLNASANASVTSQELTQLKSTIAQMLQNGWLNRWVRTCSRSFNCKA